MRAASSLPRTGQTVFGTDFFTAAGGKGANQAVAAARLGARVAMAGCVGDDQFGRDLVAGLRRDGVRSDAVQTVAHPTGTALITIDAAGANTIVVISGANAACDTALVDRALAGAGGPGILLLQHEIPEDGERARDPRGACGGMVRRAQSGAGASGRCPALLPLIDIIVPNETEAAALTGASDAAARRAASGGAGRARRAGHAGWRRCAVLRCRRRAALSRGRRCRRSTPPRPAMPISARWRPPWPSDRSVADSLGFAAAAAGLAVTRLGAQPSLATREEVAEFVQRYGMPVAVKA